MDAPTPRKPDPMDWKVEDYPGDWPPRNESRWVLINLAEVDAVLKSWHLERCVDQYHEPVCCLGTVLANINMFATEPPDGRHAPTQE